MFKHETDEAARLYVAARAGGAGCSRSKRPLLRTVAAYREGCSSKKRLHQVEVVFIPLASRRRPDIEWANV